MIITYCSNLPLLLLPHAINSFDMKNTAKVDGNKEFLPQWMKSSVRKCMELGNWKERGKIWIFTKAFWAFLAKKNYILKNLIKSSQYLENTGSKVFKNGHFKLINSFLRKFHSIFSTAKKKSTLKTFPPLFSCFHHEREKKAMIST